MPDSIKYGVADILSQEALQPMEERLAIENKPRSLFIGIPKEIRTDEHRVALTPSAVRSITSRGHRVMVEHNAGLRSRFSDHEYSEAGAEISHSHEEVLKSKVLVKVSPPTLEETPFLVPNQVLMSPLQLPMISREYVEQILEKRVTAVAMEYMKDQDGSFPIVRILSEMAGISAVQVASTLLSQTTGGPGVLLGGISGVPPVKVVILGAGIVALNAARTALGMGAQVCVFDNNIYKLIRLRNLIGHQIFTSSIDPQTLRRELKSAEVVIGAIHSPDGRAPLVVTEEMVATMKPGSVIIDISIDQGGCFETSEVTTHENPTFVKHEVIHYCVPNIASRSSRTASIGLSNIVAPILQDAGNTIGIKSLLFHNLGLRHGVYAYKGLLTNVYLSRRFAMRHTNLDLLLTSNF